MNWWISAIGTGVTAFVATNLDDIVILMLFFAQMRTGLRPHHIVLGQYLGFLVLILLCLPGYFGGLLVPASWIGLLGFIPIAIGIRHLLQSDDGDEAVQTVSEDLNPAQSRIPAVAAFQKLLAPPVFSVATVTCANGGDNIGIYVPLFASSNLASLSIILVTFFALIGIWCYLAYLLTLHPTIARLLTRYGHRITPFVLIGLGIYILLENETYHLLPWLPAR